MDARSTSEAPSGQGAVVEIGWARGRLGLAAALTLPMAFLFFAAGFHPELIVPSGSRRGNTLYWLAQSAKVGAWNPLLLALGLYLAWFGLRAAWRASEPAALRANRAGIGFHPSCFR